MIQANAAPVAMRRGTCGVLLLHLLLLQEVTAAPIHVPAELGVNPVIFSNRQRLRPHRPAQPASFHIHSFGDDMEAEHSSSRDPAPPEGLKQKGEDSDEDGEEFDGAPGPAPAPYPMTAEQARRQAKMTEREEYWKKMERLDKEASQELAESKILHAKAGHKVAKAAKDEDAMKDAKESIRRKKHVFETKKIEHQRARAAHRQARLEHREAKNHYSYSTGEKYKPAIVPEEDEATENEEPEEEEKDEQNEEKEQKTEKPVPPKGLTMICFYAVMLALLLVLSFRR